jgi:hypothetical protein
MANNKLWYLTNNITVAGGNGSYSTFISHCLDIALDYLREKHYNFLNVSVNIQIMPEFQQLIRDETCIAHVMWVDDGVMPEEFEMHLDDRILHFEYSEVLSKFTKEFHGRPVPEILLEVIITTLAHEAVHIAQMSSGIYKQIFIPGETEAVSYWNGRRVDTTKYDEDPWEIDAYNLEHLVANNIKKELEYADILLR